MVMRGQFGVYRFCESGVKWWWTVVVERGQWVCIGSVSQVLNGGEGTGGCVSVP